MRQVSVNSLTMGDILAKTIFSSSGRILLGKGVKLTPLYIAKLRDMGISILYIEDERFNDVIVEDVISEEHRRDALDILEKSTRYIRLGKDIECFELKKVINNIVAEILFKKDILVNMMDMRSKDNQMFAHSVNVCVLSTVLGKALYLDQEKLENLAVGAILHDIGKVQLDSKLFNLDSEMTIEQAELFKTHTTLGFEDLKKRKDLNLIIAHIAFQHHEYMNGTGYPRHLNEGEIHPLAQIVAIADFYDKFTSDHSTEQRIMPHEACEILMGLAGTLYPLEMVRQFLKNIAAYPTGISVRLNTGEIGVVVDQNLSMPTRPIIRVFDESEFGQNDVKEYDMVEKRTIFIEKVLG
ncbi:MAG TPA: c-di-GMP phosphodiesterase [Desulfosporosinus sp.]|jgi:putative nucleotidyltransferase with HDIG domain|nr:c-di-GMP phosphodiesterase [Desulfosporosinus sp.]